jgi:hypothetical protein
MRDRRLVGIDLGITSVHTVRVLAGDGAVVCRRKPFQPWTVWSRWSGRP